MDENHYMNMNLAPHKLPSQYVQVWDICKATGVCGEEAKYYNVVLNLE